MNGRVLLAVALAALAALSAGCQAVFELDAEVNRDGRGTLGLRLSLDRDAQSALGISTDDDPAAAAERFAPMLSDGGWAAGDAQIAAARDEDSGELVLETSHPVDSISSPAAGWGTSGTRPARETRRWASGARCGTPSRSPTGSACPGGPATPTPTRRPRARTSGGHVMAIVLRSRPRQGAEAPVPW